MVYAPEVRTELLRLAAREPLGPEQPSWLRDFAETRASLARSLESRGVEALSSWDAVQRELAACDVAILGDSHGIDYCRAVLSMAVSACTRSSGEQGIALTLEALPEHMAVAAIEKAGAGAQASLMEVRKLLRSYWPWPVAAYDHVLDALRAPFVVGGLGIEQTWPSIADQVLDRERRPQPVEDLVGPLDDTRWLAIQALAVQGILRARGALGHDVKVIVIMGFAHVHGPLFGLGGRMAQLGLRAIASSFPLTGSSRVTCYASIRTTCLVSGFRWRQGCSARRRRL